jgi:hypothetical protein
VGLGVALLLAGWGPHSDGLAVALLGFDSSVEDGVAQLART